MHRAAIHPLIGQAGQLSFAKRKIPRRAINIEDSAEIF
jgi:hypothetical protein